MENEKIIRLSVFFGLFVLFAAIETLAPRRPLTAGRGRRWITNWGMSIANTLITRLMSIALPLLAVGAAIDAGQNGIGLLNGLDFPAWAEVGIAILFFDFAIWFQHLITHKVPLLWRLHRVHHSDRDLDVTTAIRFHPLEIALSMGIKIGLVYVMGPSAVAIVLFEILLNGSAMFNHANLRLPLTLDRVLITVYVWFWSRPTCTACIIRYIARNMTATMALPCQSGTGCLAPILPNLRWGMMRWISG